MADIQSNYPRQAALKENIDICGLRLWAVIGLIVAISFGSLVAFLKLEAVLVGRLQINSPSFLIMAFFLGFMAILLMVCIAVWTAKAYGAVCQLRGMEPKIHPTIVGIFSAIPLIFLFLPLFYTLEFLIIRSKDAETPIMGKGNYFSWSPLANNFGFSIFAFLATTVIGNFIDDVKIRSLNSNLNSFSLLYALVAGCAIVIQTNRNLAKHVTGTT